MIVAYPGGQNNTFLLLKARGLKHMAWGLLITLIQHIYLRDQVKVALYCPDLQECILSLYPSSLNIWFTLKRSMSREN